MDSYPLTFSQDGLIIITPDDDCHRVVDAMLAIEYSEEFCVALDFDPWFVAELMEAGFLVMSLGIKSKKGKKWNYILLPKLHLERSVVFWENMRETKTARRLSHRYELRVDCDFDFILERCAAVHGEDWLTPPLRQCLKEIRAMPNAPVRPISFGVYREGELKAGEFGVLARGTYTSYSGYHDENSAGTVQLLLLGRYMRESGFAFWDLGMPLEYKDRLGATTLLPEQFVKIFRDSFVRNTKP